MAATAEMTPDRIRACRADAPKLRDRDVAENLGISEAELVAAHVGADGPRRAVRVAAHPDQLMPAAEAMGEVMSLTRNPSAVHEKIGRYGNDHMGQHAAMVLTEAVDLRILPSHWRHAFLLEVDADEGVRRSLQVPDK